MPRTQTAADRLAEWADETENGTTAAEDARAVLAALADLHARVGALEELAVYCAETHADQLAVLQAENARSRALWPIVLAYLDECDNGVFGDRVRELLRGSK